MFQVDPVMIFFVSTQNCRAKFLLLFFILGQKIELFVIVPGQMCPLVGGQLNRLFWLIELVKT